MIKKILITGSTDGIGLETAKALLAQGHQILIHGRNQQKLDAVINDLKRIPNAQPVEGYVADLSDLDEVEHLAGSIKLKHTKLDVLINNAGVFKANSSVTKNGQDIRFVVNTLAPYLLTQQLIPIMPNDGRVVNLSSAAQAPVNLNALNGSLILADEFLSYSQSKLALTMWSQVLGQELRSSGPIVVSVNPGSLLATKMVKDGFGLAGNNIEIGVDILVRAALSDKFARASGKYFDNDAGRFADPHFDAKNELKVNAVMTEIKKYFDRRFQERPLIITAT